MAKDTPHDKADFPELSDIQVAGGRALPELFFITNRAALGESIGWYECEVILSALQGQGYILYDEVPSTIVPGPAVSAVQQRLATLSNVEGVVILGGYDVVPSVRVDCLPSSLRGALQSNSDADDFIVWNDDAYGDPSGKRGLDIPVSRIPDGKSATLLLAALQTTAGGNPSSRYAVRNVARPFADEVFDLLPGPGEMLVSEPVTFDQEPAVQLQGDRIYLMLHGEWYDSSRFWGEGTLNSVEAVNIDNIERASGSVVLTGCCWGALIVDTPANRVLTGRSWGFGPKTAHSSMALHFLLRGASAFVGCTGSHYSPSVSPYGYFGGPLHQAFWTAHLSGSPPAQALLEAKWEYAWGIPHGQESATVAAIEFKMLRQFTCLGLGW